MLLRTEDDLLAGCTGAPSEDKDKVNIILNYLVLSLGERPLMNVIP